MNMLKKCLPDDYNVYNLEKEAVNNQVHQKS